MGFVLPRFAQRREESGEGECLRRLWTGHEALRRDLVNFFLLLCFFLGPAAIRPGDFEPSSRERRGSLCAGSFACFVPHSGSARRNKFARFQETDWVVEGSRCRNQCRQVVCGSFSSQVCSNYIAMLAMMAAAVLYTATASRGPPLFANAAQTSCTILGSTR